MPVTSKLLAGSSGFGVYSQRQDATLPPPGLGEHGDALLEWVSVDELARLKAAGVVG